MAFEDPKHDYDAVELTFDRRFSANWLLTGSLSLVAAVRELRGLLPRRQRPVGPGDHLALRLPDQRSELQHHRAYQFGYRGDIRYLGALGEGPLPLDRPHQVKVFGNYTWDNGLSVGVGSTFGSGKPLTALASLAVYNNDSEIPESARGEGFDTVDGIKKRTPFEAQVDLQASYTLNMAGNRRLTLLADAFNLFNIRRAVDYNAATETAFGVSNPDFGTVTSQNIAGQMFQTPFALRLGARFGW